MAGAMRNRTLFQDIYIYIYIYMHASIWLEQNEDISKRGVNLYSL